MKYILFAFILSSFLFRPAIAQDKPNFYCNPITLNGHQLDYETFSINSRGVLAIVVGDPQSSKHKPVPFLVSIRRAGSVIKRYPTGDAKENYSVQLDDLMPYAQIGDELLIEPTGFTAKETNNQQGRRIIKLKSYNWIKLALNDC